MDRKRTFLENARKCDAHASSITDRRMIHLFRDLAEQWRDLAALAGEMAEESKRATEFFNSGR
jgi:hypothetical protein